MISCRWRYFATSLAGVWRLLVVGVFFLLFFSLNVSIKAGLLRSDQPQWVATQELGPNVNYGLIIDAGSSGSRIHIYIWPPHSGNPRELLQIQPLRTEAGEPIHHRITPGLSSVAQTPWEATNYMTPLLQFAAKHIPQEKHKETPLYILATAGMRLLEKSEQVAILDNLRADIPRNFSFLFTDSNVEIISGKQEGVYQWLAINFVLGLLKPNDEFHDHHATAGIMDMGGASMQIAFQLPENGTFEKDIKSHTVEVNIGSQADQPYFQYSLYVNTFLGYGANEQFNLHRKTLLAETENQEAKQVKSILQDSCFPKSYKENITNLATDKSIMQLLGTGDWDNCLRNLGSYLKNQDCLNGSHCFNAGLPSEGLLKVHFFGFSEFWYTMEDVFRLGGKYNFKKLRNSAQQFCSTDWSVLSRRLNQGLYPLANADRLRGQCFKAAWLSAVIHHLFHLPPEYSLLTSTPNDVGGHVVAWTLGALLYKTRFFPLRLIQKGNPQNWFHTVAATPKIYFNQTILAICVFVVMVGVYILMRKIKRQSKYSGFKRVPTHEGQFTILVDNSYLLPGVR